MIDAQGGTRPPSAPRSVTPGPCCPSTVTHGLGHQVSQRRGEFAEPSSGSAAAPHAFRRFADFARERHGRRVHKITVDAGFDCPNRDGRLAFGGCSFCDNETFAPQARARGRGAQAPIAEQVREGLAKLRRRDPSALAYVYFQAYTNTYAPVPVLRERYLEALEADDSGALVVLDIGTRPDCVGDEVLDLLADLAPRTTVWLELGLQTAHDATQARLNRWHTLEDFHSAMLRSTGRGLLRCAHIILGLPGETREDMQETAHQVARSAPEGVKIHQLYIPVRSALAAPFRAGELALLTRDEFVELAADAVERLPPSTAIMRLGAELAGPRVLGPHWPGGRGGLPEQLDAILARRGTRQGSRYAQHEMAGTAGRS